MINSSDFQFGVLKFEGFRRPSSALKLRQCKIAIFC